jgi:hypothetical protein
VLGLAADSPVDSSASLATSALPGFSTLYRDRRYTRWEQILARYAALGQTRGVSIALRQRIVVGDDSLLELVNSCGVPGDVSPRFACSIADAVAYCDSTLPVLFIVPRHLLTATAIIELAHRVRTPWGVVTGRDPGAIAFALIKQQLARHVAPGPALLADFVSDVMGAVSHQGSLHGSLAPSSMKTWDLLRRLTRPTGSFLLAHCHGDGAHGDFRNVVLCGLCDDEELLFDGRSGCCRRTNDGGHVCKRNPTGARQPVRCGDLAATTVCLLTCNGSSVAGQGYPSDCSFVLSFAEGFPAAVLTTDHRIPFTGRDVAAVAGLLTSGLPLGETAQLLNNESAELFGVRPYVLFGDPTIVPAPPMMEQTARAADEPPPPRRTVRQKTQMSSTTRETRADVYRIITVLAARLRIQDNMLATCATLCPQHSPDSDAMLDGHARILRAIRAHLGLGNELAAAPAHVSESDLDTWQAALALLVGAADQSLITLVHERVPQRDMHLLFSAGLVGSRRETDRECVACGTLLCEERYTSPIVAPEYTVTTSCSHCGPEAAWEGDGPLIAATVPRVAYVGATFDVSIDICRNTIMRSAFRVPPLASVRFRDVGRSSDDTIEGCGTGPAPRVATIGLKSDTTLENNTVRIAAAHELSLGMLRAGVVVLPP